MSYGVGCRVGSDVHRSRACRMTAWQRPGQVHRGSRRLRVGIWRAYGALLIIPAGDIDLRELRIEDEAEMIAQEEREREECALSEIIWRLLIAADLRRAKEYSQLEESVQVRHGSASLADGSRATNSWHPWLRIYPHSRQTSRLYQARLPTCKDAAGRLRISSRAERCVRHLVRPANV